MAILKSPLKPSQVKKTGVASLRTEYDELASEYKKILDGEYLMCPKCGEWMKNTGFYSDKNYNTGKFPICKSCLLMMAEQRKKKNDEPNETKESVRNVLRMMDLPYIDSFYESCVKGSQEDTGVRKKSSPFIAYITSIKSLPNWKGLTWRDSEFEPENDEVYEDSSLRTARPEIKKLFGSGLSENDYVFLQDQYDDWKARTQVDTKSQETYIIRICFKLLDIWKAEKSGSDTEKLDKSLNDLMSAANLQPKQNVGNASTDTLTFGQLIEKWEQERPISEPDPEFRDVDGIGKYIRVFFAGHLAKALGLHNAYTEEYDEYMKEYTVEKPTIIEEGGSADIYDKIFGSEGGD